MLQNTLNLLMIITSYVCGELCNLQNIFMSIFPFVNFSSYANIGEWVDQDSLSAFIDLRVKFQLNTLLHLQRCLQFSNLTMLSVREDTWQLTRADNWKMIWHYQVNLKICPPYDPAISILEQTLEKRLYMYPSKYV